MTANSMKSKSANYIASVVAAYWVISISMVYLNKVRLCIAPPPPPPHRPPIRSDRSGPDPSPSLFHHQVLMTNSELSIPAPLFVTWFQCLFTVGLCYLCGELGELQRKKVSSRHVNSVDGRFESIGLFVPPY